ncbi:Protein GAMETE EXPRESSED 3 [Quillaja saponaria]|uniref:Protein GAMETE EXPRESSED 3 n=1 Tax=Quillaja saponaria TaxID=32244 RepID=A0AAD7Q3M9_QUISA|nr:Protein GAMETE EXPRESSED 3 [Quillaja saponaria]
MPTMQSLLILVQLASITSFSVFAAQETSKSLSYRLSKPLIGDNGRIYACSEKNLFAFESNGTIAWTIHLNYKCNDGMSPVHGGIGKIYLVAENRVVKINFHNIGTAEPASEVFFGPGPGEEAQVEIIGITVSTLSSIVFISIKNRGLFAYMMHGHLLWSAGPVLYQFGYRQGCGKNATDCYFASVPFLDQCEANVYISNTEGELYCLSVHSPHFKWIRDFSSLDKVFTITPGNNGRLYVTVPVRLLVLALDVFSGNILWQRNIGPLSKAECAPVVDSNGWISIGSLDGFLYSFSPTGDLKKFSRRNIKDSVVQVGPFLDCSGYAVYISQTEMERKVSRTIGQYTYISATQPKTGVFTMLVPATGSIYWSESYTGQFSSLLSKNDLAQFVVDEEILLAFAAASKTGNPLQCRSPGQRLASSCSQARTKLVSIYTGNERAILLFLLFESAVLALVAGLVRFCCTFWTKRKIQGQGLGSFLDKRRSLRLKKKAFDRTITELEQKAAEEAVANEVYEKLGDMVRERECIERKLSTTYSLGRDRTGSQSKALLPLHIGRTRSYSFQGAKKESVTIFHTLSDTSSISESSSETEMDQLGGMESATRGKEKAPTESDSSSEDEDFGRGYRRSPSEPASSSEGFMSLLGPEDSWEVKLCNKGESKSEQNTHSSLWLKRRRALSSTN